MTNNMNACIENKLTRQRIIFLVEGRGDEQLVMRMSYTGRGPKPPRHYHVNQRESFSIIRGELLLTHNGRTERLGAGNSFQISEGEVHAMSNGIDGITEVDWVVYPALETAAFFRESFTLANQRYNQGKKGLSGLDKIRLAYKYRGIIRIKLLP